MSGLDNLKTRLNYMGGGRKESRMQQGKLRALKKALISSYQAATAIIGGKEFRCLINPDQLKADYDTKILSIPFKDICLNEDRVGTTTQGEQDINIQVGDVFTWKETNTNWLVYLRYLEEDAYFRADIRRCNHEAEINGRKYSVYARGPVENSLNWKKGNLEMYNELNYTLIMYITKDEFTLDYFERFKKIKIDNKPWEVQAVDTISSMGIIEVALKETFSNTLEEEMKDAETETNGNQEAGSPHIVGSTIVYPYETYSYSIDGLVNGIWSVDNMKLVKINGFDSAEVSISIKTGRSGNFTLSYTSGSQTVELPIVIESI
jgi:hypothetical protein